MVLSAKQILNKVDNRFEKVVKAALIEREMIRLENEAWAKYTNHEISTLSIVELARVESYLVRKQQQLTPEAWKETWESDFDLVLDEIMKRI